MKSQSSGFRDRHPADLLASIGVGSEISVKDVYFRMEPSVSVTVSLAVAAGGGVRALVGRRDLV